MIFFLIGAGTRVVRKLKEKKSARKQQKEQEAQNKPLCDTDSETEASTELHKTSDRPDTDNTEKSGIIGKVQTAHAHLREKRVNVVKAIRD